LEYASVAAMAAIRRRGVSRTEPRIVGVRRPITAVQPAAPSHAEAPSRPVLTVVVPVYNGGEKIIENVAVIRHKAAAGLRPEDVELVVVSDGSIDGTSERLLAARSDVEMRVIQYDRNFGKGYAVKLGTLASRGDWIAVVDADLDLDPGSVPVFLATARRDNLDFAIGSKRHPDSVVHYPRSRRVASWGYQQLNRLLFRLDVRDTQVGIKVFRREVADEVVPLLLVKQFAFDLELLAVARSLGFERVRELPVRLDYRFTGSQVRSRAVLRALLDTAAIFYRLRILRTYQRKRQLLGVRPRTDELPLVSVIGDSSSADLDYPLLEQVGGQDPAQAALEARGDLLAVLAPGARPAGNWLTASVPFFSREEIAAVVVPAVVPPDARLREQAAAAVLESRLGAGSRRSRYLPGNVRIIEDFPADSFVVTKQDFLAAMRAKARDDLFEWLAEHGRRTVYTPDTMISAAPDRLFGPHLRATLRHAARRGAAARRTNGRSVSSATMLSFVPVGCALVGAALLALGPRDARQAGVVLVVAYGAGIAVSAGLAAARFRSLRVGALSAPGLAATQAAYIVGFVRGFAQAR
jgi:glycosyltransferase involved in cell wall biosynthesis